MHQSAEKSTSPNRALRHARSKEADGFVCLFSISHALRAALYAIVLGSMAYIATTALPLFPVFAAPLTQSSGDPCAALPDGHGPTSKTYNNNGCTARYPAGVVSIEPVPNPSEARTRIDESDKFLCIKGTEIKNTYGDYAKEWSVSILQDGGCAPQNDSRFPKRYFLQFSSACFYISLSSDPNRPGDPAALKNIAAQIDQKLKTLPLCSNIEHIEIVQVIQAIDNTIPLVAGKGTVVRVFLKETENQPKSQFTGVLRGSRNSQELTPLNGPLTPPANPSRANLDDSLNFLLPLDWTAEGSVTFEAELKVPGETTDPSKPKTANKSKTKSLAFTKRNSLTIAYMPMCIGAIGSKDQVCAEGDLAVKYDALIAKLFPIADKGLVYFGLQTPAVAWRKPLVTDQDSAALRSFLRKIYFLIDQSGAELFDELAAWLPWDAAIKSAGGEGDTIGASPASNGRVSWQQDTGILGIIYPQKTLAHEVGHALGLLHPETPDSCGAKQPHSGWPYPTATIQEFGFDVLANKVIPNTFFDVMSYCDATKIWISPYSYKRLFDGNLRPRVPEYSAAQNFPNGSALFPVLATLQVRAEYLIISGSVKRDASAARLDPAYHINSATPADPSDASGNHCLRFSGANGTLANYCFTLRFESHQTHTALDEEAFTVKAAFPAGTQRVALLRNDKELAALDTKVPAPSLSITSPRAGETWDSKRTVSWSASSPPSSGLAYAVMYTSDGGKTWLPLDIDSNDSQLTIDTSKLASGDQVQFRVLASTGLNSTQADSPLVKILPQSKPGSNVIGSLAPIVIGAGAFAMIAILGIGLLLIVRSRSRSVDSSKNAARQSDIPATQRDTISKPTDLPESRSPKPPTTLPR